MNINEDDLFRYLATFMWPFFRVSSMFISIPVFSGNTIPPQIKVLAGLGITLVILPSLPPQPMIEIFSFDGWLVTLQQIALGISAGFILQMVFAIMMFAGQAIAYSMGLGFANMVDPTTGVQVPVIAQLFVMSSSLLFLSVDGHLLMIEMLAQSFHSLPVAKLGMVKTDLWRMVAWSSQIFADGLLLSLPITATLLFVNISFGVVSKAAPQLQIFGVGFPITIILGMLLIWVGLPNMLEGFGEILHRSFNLVSELLRLN